MSVLTLEGVLVPVSADFDVSFIDIDGGRRCEPLSSCWMVPFERALPVRAFSSYKRKKASRAYGGLLRLRSMSVAAGKISSVTLLRRLSTYSRRNNFYKAFREVGRVIRTIQLLRYLSDPQLRRRTTAATNKVESCNNFSAWCRFGNEGRVRDNDPAEQEKQVKFSTLLTNAVIFHTTLDMMAVLRQLAAEGREISPADLAVLSPYQTMRINRFGVYATDEISVTPEQYDAHLPDIDLTLDLVP
jgi:hypothetical protein